MSIKYINNNDKVIDNSYLAELDNVIHPVGIIMPWIKHIVPEEVCKGMVDMLDSTGWFIKNIDKSPQEYIDSHRVLDICCRSGNFLRAFYERFNVYLSYKIKNQDKRDYFIWRYLLFGFAGQIREELSKGLTADQENKVADAAIKELRKELYSGFCFYEEDFHGNIYDIQFRPYLDGNNLDWTGKDCPGYTTTFENRAFGKELNEMKFNAVIGNPPYNNDAYIDFVTKGHAIATDYSLWITPAKWQAKGGEKNETFRKNIVPHMSKIVYYKETQAVFNIGARDGISYYLLTKDIGNINVKCICDKNRTLESSMEKHDEKPIILLPNSIIEIINKCRHGNFKDTISFKRCVFVGEQERGTIRVPLLDDIAVMQGEDNTGYIKKSELYTTENLDKWKCTTSIMVGTNADFNINGGGKVVGLAKISIIEPNQVPKGSFPVLRYFDTKEECESFRSFMYSSFVGFLFYLGVCGATMTNEFFRFVPDPVAFDKIYEDKPLSGYEPDKITGEYIDSNGKTHCSLYAKYKLTEEEINIIESVIKERK